MLWYGGDGSARATALITTSGSATFAISVGGCPNPLIGLPEDFAVEHADLVAAIFDIAGIEPDAFGLAAYDAANVLIEAILTAGDDDLRETFLGIADGYDGVTGVIDLNENGDRATAPFDFWSICDDGEGGAEWLITATWAPGATTEDPGTITAGSCEAPF